MQEFLVTILALIVGFLVARQVSNWLYKAGVPIASGDIQVLPLPGAACKPGYAPGQGGFCFPTS